MKYHAISIVAMTLLASCGTNGIPKWPALTIPQQWQQAKGSNKPIDSAALAMWWKRFHDPVLNGLIADALHSSPDVRSALAKVSEYRARRGVELAGLFPALDANQTGRGIRTDNNTLDVRTSTQLYGASLDASWQVDLFGKQSQTVKAASADLAQMNENYYGAQVTLAADVATAYVTLRSTEAQIVVVEESLKTRQDTVELTQWQEQAGTGDALNTQRSISDLEQARASLPALKLAITQTTNQLALLAGRSPGSLDSKLAPQHSVPMMKETPTAGIPAETLRQRPDVRAAERGVEAAFARKESAKRQRFPVLTLNGSIGVEALKAGRIFSPESSITSLLGSLATPIIDAGRIRENIAVLSALERQSLIAYEATVLTALAEVENALAAVQRYSEQLGILSKATNAARESVKYSSLQYRAGQVDLLILLDAQRTLLSLEQQQVTTAAQRAGACIQLYKSLGGGWSKS